MHGNHSHAPDHPSWWFQWWAASPRAAGAHACANDRAAP